MKEKLKDIASKINMKYLFLVIPIILILLLIIVSSVFTINNDTNTDTKDKKETKKEQEIKTNIYTTKDNRVDFTFNEGFKNSEVGEYDLYVKDEERQLIMGVFTYDLNNYEENTGKEILDKQVTYFLKTRNDMKIFKEETTKEYDDKKIITVEYSGKTTDSADCVYLFSALEFNNAPGYIVYSTNVIIKEHYEEYIKEVKEILKNAKLK